MNLRENSGFISSFCAAEPPFLSASAFSPLSAAAERRAASVSLSSAVIRTYSLSLFPFSDIFPISVLSLFRRHIQQRVQRKVIQFPRVFPPEISFPAAVVLGDEHSAVATRRRKSVRGITVQRVELCGNAVRGRQQTGHARFFDRVEKRGRSGGRKLRFAQSVPAQQRKFAAVYITYNKRFRALNFGVGLRKGSRPRVSGVSAPKDTKHTRVPSGSNSGSRSSLR